MKPRDLRFESSDCKTWQPTNRLYRTDTASSSLTEEPLFMVYSGEYYHLTATICIYKNQKQAIQWCKRQVQSYRIKAESRGYYPHNNEALIAPDTEVIDISGPSREHPHSEITFTVQRCGPNGMSLALRAYLAKGQDSLQELWVLYDVTNGKIWRVLIDEADAESHRIAQEPRNLADLAIKGVAFKDDFL